MSIYEFVCRDCKKKFQRVEAITEHREHVEKCPKCHGKNVDRIWSSVNVVTAKKS